MYTYSFMTVQCAIGSRNKIFFHHYFPLPTLLKYKKDFVYWNLFLSFVYFTTFTVIKEKAFLSLPIIHTKTTTTLPHTHYIPTTCPSENLRRESPERRRIQTLQRDPYLLTCFSPAIPENQSSLKTQISLLVRSGKCLVNVGRP